MNASQKRKHKFGSVRKFAPTEMEIMKNEIKFHTGKYISHPVTFDCLLKICLNTKKLNRS